MIELIFIAILLIIAFIQTYNTIYKIKNFDLVDSDTYSHLRIAEEFVEEKGLIKYHKCYYPGEKLKYTYPPMLHYILFILYNFTSLYFKKSISLWFSFLTCITFGITLYFNFDFNFSTIVIVSILFFISNGTETLRVITPRPLGIFFFFLTLLGMSACAHEGKDYFLLMGAGSGFLFLTHRMGVQILILLILAMLPLSLVISDIPVIIYFTSLILSFLLAFALTKGQIFHVLKDHIKRIVYHISYGNQWDGTKRLGSIKKIVLQNPLIIFPLSSMPINYFFIENNLWNSDIIFLITISFILFLSIFWIWGSGERHIIFATPLILIEASFLIQQNVGYTLIFIPSILIILKLLYNSWGARGEVFEYVDNEWKRFGEILRNQRGKSILLLPQTTILYLVYTSKKAFISAAHCSTRMTFNRLQIKWKLDDHQHIYDLAIRHAPDIILNENKYHNPRLDRFLLERYKLNEVVKDYKIWILNNE